MAVTLHASAMTRLVCPNKHNCCKQIFIHFIVEGTDLLVVGWVIIWPQEENSNGRFEKLSNEARYRFCCTVIVEVRFIMEGDRVVENGWSGMMHTRNGRKSWRVDDRVWCTHGTRENRGEWMIGYDAHTEQQRIVESGWMGMMHTRNERELFMIGYEALKTQKKKTPGIECVFCISLQFLIVELFAQTNV